MRARLQVSHRKVPPCLLIIPIGAPQRKPLTILQQEEQRRRFLDVNLRVIPGLVQFLITSQQRAGKIRTRFQSFRIIGAPSARTEAAMGSMKSIG